MIKVSKLRADFSRRLDNGGREAWAGDEKGLDRVITEKGIGHKFPTRSVRIRHENEAS